MVADSIAHCISADFKMSSGIAQELKLQFPTKIPTKEMVNNAPLWPQVFNQSQRFLYHLITKRRYFHKPTYKNLRASLIGLRTHAETNNVTRISLPRIGCGLDKLDWKKVMDMI